MEKFLNIALIQTTIIWQNNVENLKNYSKKINEIQQEIDVVILPEMFTTGFTMKPKEVGEQMNGRTVEWMKKMAAEKDVAICGSVIIEEESKFYNRFLFVHPSGEINFYNKRHLFTLAGEEKVYTAGDKKIIIDYKGWKICPQVCYDLRFPVYARNVENYDVLIYVANWPKVRINAWDILLKARAVENMSYVVGVNRVGVDFHNFEYSGHSAVFNCLGEQICDSKVLTEEIIVCKLEKKHITTVRNKLNFLNDRDDFKLL